MGRGHRSRTQRRQGLSRGHSRRARGQANGFYEGAGEDGRIRSATRGDSAREDSVDTRHACIKVTKFGAHVTCHSESSAAATICWVRGSKTKYSPGMSEANWLKRRRAVSKSPTTASKTRFPRRSFLKMSNEDKTSSAPDSSDCPLSSVGGGSSNFPFHLVFFPAAYFLSSKAFGVIAMVTWITPIERGLVNLLPYPSLS